MLVPVGYSAILTVNLVWISSKTFLSLSSETNDIVNPLVPNLPALPTYYN